MDGSRQNRLNLKLKALRYKKDKKEVIEILDSYYEEYLLYDLSFDNKKILSIWNHITRIDYPILPSGSIKNINRSLLSDIKSILIDNLLENVIVGFISFTDEFVFEYKFNKSSLCKITNENWVNQMAIGEFFLDEKGNFVIFFDDDIRIEVYIGHFMQNRVKFDYPETLHSNDRKENIE